MYDPDKDNHFNEPIEDFLNRRYPVGTDIVVSKGNEYTTPNIMFKGKYASLKVFMDFGVCDGEYVTRIPQP